MTSPVQAQTLGNGLTVITREVHDAPVATFWTWYRVGSRNEVPGITGISHWVEHMMFKGTANLGKGEIFRSVSKNGGTLNGFTWIDYTTYFETLPSNRLDLAIQIEADRMSNSTFSPEEVESERTVIISEREGDENFPTSHLDEEVTAAAFKAHPYGHPVIGWKSDLQAMTRQELYDYYRTHYVPNNAVVVAVGDFSTDQLLKKIEQQFGDIPRGPNVQLVRSREPRQEGERKVVVRRPGPAEYFMVVYHAPAADHPDVFPLLVLDAILSGAKPMGLYSGHDTAMGRSSRLYRALVDTGLCTGAGSSFGLTQDPYLFGISASLQPQAGLPEVERIVFDEIDRLAASGIQPDEVEKAINQVRAQFVYASEGVTNQAYWLGDLEMVARYQLLDEFVERVAAVTPADVQRVAQTYLTRSNRTIGWFEPTELDGAAEVPHAPMQAFRRWWFSQPQRAESTLAIKRQKLTNGTVVLGHERTLTPAVVVQMSVQAGSMYDPAGKEGLAHFTARLMQRGTSRHTFQQISELTDRVGSSLNTSGQEHALQVGGRCLKDDLDLLIGLMVEILREPIFPAPEIEKYRGQLLTNLREQNDDPGFVSEKIFRQLAYPAGHPYHRWPYGDEASIASLTRDDLIAFHHRYVQPNRLMVTFAGGIGFDEFLDKLTRALSNWTTSGPAAPFAIPDAPPLNEVVRRDVVMPGKLQSEFALGCPTIRRSNPDFYALSMADLILGGLGLSGRLGEVVRDEAGLAYTVYSNVGASLGPAPWEVRAGINPKNVERAIELTIKEVNRIRHEPVADDELQDGKSYLTGVLPLSLETIDGVARILQSIETFDLGLDYLDRYPGIINALTKEQVREAAERHFSTDRIAVVVAGPGL